MTIFMDSKILKKKSFHFISSCIHEIGGLVQKRRNSTANALGTGVTSFPSISSHLIAFFTLSYISQPHLISFYLLQLAPILTVRSPSVWCGSNKESVTPTPTSCCWNARWRVLSAPHVSTARSPCNTTQINWTHTTHTIGPLWEKSNGHRWIPLTNGQWFRTLMFSVLLA